MFDGQKRLVFSNQRYAQLYKLPPHLTVTGTPLEKIVKYRRSIGNAPVDVPYYVTHEGLDTTPGKTTIFEFRLEDGRTIRINHLNMQGGSYIASHEDITEMVRAEARVARASTVDVLTNLPNRTSFRQGLSEALRGLKAGQRICVVSLDLDRFTSINETLGHSAGDALLLQAVERLHNTVGDCHLARVGGDQFALIQIGKDQPESARTLAQNLLDAFDEPFDLEGSKLVTTASVGIAFAPDHGNEPDQLLRNAEMAQNWVKAHGRGSFQFFDPAMMAASQSRHEMARGLRHALSRNELEIHYQPVVALASDAVAGFEALLRWKHPQRGYIPPAEFVPIAEEIGIISEIGAWVLSNACQEAARWPRELCVAVNLSSLQVKDPNLLQVVFKALANSSLRAGRLELEITESVLLSDTENTLSVLHQLRELGVRIAMDDFGTGYSSLSYLRLFPFDKIKIDQSFVREMMESPQSWAIVRAIVGLAKEFGLATTAEGVETVEQLAQLRSLGCDEVQGFLVGAAAPRDEILSLAVNNKRIKRIRAA
jgi:diguanylate cyclase (GGDEF)-like protein